MQFCILTDLLDRSRKFVWLSSSISRQNCHTRPFLYLSIPLSISQSLQYVKINCTIYLWILHDDGYTCLWRPYIDKNEIYHDFVKNRPLPFLDLFEILLDYRHVDKYELYYEIFGKNYCVLDYFTLILGAKQQNQISRD